jgi:hypothetical protein
MFSLPLLSVFAALRETSLSSLSNTLLPLRDTPSCSTKFAECALYIYYLKVVRCFGTLGHLWPGGDNLARGLHGGHPNL